MEIQKVHIVVHQLCKARSLNLLLSIFLKYVWTAWWNGYLLLQFLKYHFAARQDPSKSVLLLDDFSGRWIREVVEFAASINVVLLRVPPGATSVCQPADVA